MEDETNDSKLRNLFDGLATVALLACAALPSLIVTLMIVGVGHYGGIDGLLPWPWWICLASSIVVPFVVVLVRIKWPEAPIVQEDPVEATESQPIEEGTAPEELRIENA